NYLKNTNSDYLVLNYRKLMTEQAEFSRLQEFVGPDIHLEDRRKASLYRNLPKKSFLLNITTGLLSWKTGLHATEIVRQIETLERSNPTAGTSLPNKNSLPAVKA